MQMTHFDTLAEFFGKIAYSVPFGCGRLGLRPFGINTAHFPGSLFPKNSANLSKCAICMWQTGFQAIWHQCCSFRWIIVSKELGQSVKMCHLHVADGVSGHLASMLLISLDHCFQRIRPICQNVPFACGRRGFRPFGINAAHFVGSLFPKNWANLSKCAICMWQTGFQAIWHQCCSFRWII